MNIQQITENKEDNPMADLFELSTQIEQRARKIVEDTKVIDIWKSAGAEINLVGSLKMGLMMKHRDIDFHIYSPSLDTSEDFFTMAKLASNPSVTRIEYINLVNTEENCIEWHAWCRDQDGEIWQLDMIHILKGSFYDGYMEQVSDRILQVMTPEMKRTILRLKYDTPDEEKIAGIEYYQAVIRGCVQTYGDFLQWRKTNPLSGVLQWMP